MSKHHKNCEKSLPISWVFLRSAVYASGNMFLEIEEFRALAQQCHIDEESFQDFLKTFTGVGSFIYIPDIEVFNKYVVLNPFDFFNELNELFRPRFNGDLRFGFVTMSSLRRMFGTGSLLFYQCLLKSCHFAIPLDAKRIMYDDTTEFISVEECFYVPVICKKYLSAHDISNIEHSLLLLIKDHRSPPGAIPLIIIESLLHSIKELKIIASPYYNMVSLMYNTITFQFITYDSSIMEFRFIKEVAHDELQNLCCALIHAVNAKQEIATSFAIPCIQQVQAGGKLFDGAHLLQDGDHKVCSKCKPNQVKWISNVSHPSKISSL